MEYKHFYYEAESMVLEFNTVAKSEWDFELRKALIEEEMEEFAEALTYKNRVEMLDACIDTIYIAIGTILLSGDWMNDDEALHVEHCHIIAARAFARMLTLTDCPLASFEEVHRSNMAKFPGGVVLKNDSGKVIKPAGWEPPELEQYLK